MPEKNYLRLPNPPKEVIDFSHEMYEKYSKLEFNNPMSSLHFSSDVNAKEAKYISKLIPQEVPRNVDLTVSMNLITDAHLPFTHIDRGRKVALQIPVIADPKIHKVYVLTKGKYFKKLTPYVNEKAGFHQKNEITTWDNQRYPGMPMFHYYQEKFFHTCVVEPDVAHLTDTSVPHGGIHYDGLNKNQDKEIAPRWFLSISLHNRMSILEREPFYKHWL